MNGPKPVLLSVSDVIIPWYGIITYNDWFQSRCLLYMVMTRHIHKKLLFLWFQYLEVCDFSPLGMKCPSFRTLHAKSGECYHPTTKGPCAEDEWLVVKDSELLVCEKNPCTKPNQV